MTLSLQTPEEVSRRRFLETSARAGLGLWLAQNPLLTQDVDGNAKKRYANVGVGSRSILFQEAINKTYAGSCEMVGYCDVNEGRLRLAEEWGQATKFCFMSLDIKSNRSARKYSQNKILSGSFRAWVVFSFECLRVTFLLRSSQLQ